MNLSSFDNLQAQSLAWRLSVQTQSLQNGQNPFQLSSFLLDFGIQIVFQTRNGVCQTRCHVLHVMLKLSQSSLNIWLNQLQKASLVLLPPPPLWPQFAVILRLLLSL